MTPPAKHLTIAARPLGWTVGVVLQRDNLHPLLDVAGNVALPLRLDGRPVHEVKARVDELLCRVGLAERRRHRVAQLSGGEFYPAQSNQQIHQVYDTLDQQVGYQTVRKDVSRPWLILGTLICLAAAGAGLLTSQRLPA